VQDAYRLRIAADYTTEDVPLERAQSLLKLAREILEGLGVEVI